jgi:hypothetical protein
VKYDLFSCEEGKGAYETLFYSPAQTALHILIYTLPSANHAQYAYLLIYQEEAAPHLADWLRLLSEGIVSPIEEKEPRLLAGPVIIEGDDCWNGNHDHSMGEVLLLGTGASDLLTELCGTSFDLAAPLSCIQYKQETLYTIFLQTPERMPVWKLIGTRQCLSNLLSTISGFSTQHFQTVTQHSDAAQLILPYAHARLGTIPKASL